MDYKGKSLEKTLLRAGDKIDVSDTEMKTINVNGVRYYIESEDELIDLAHQLARKGYSLSQIASLLNVSERKVKRYLNDCW